MSARVLGPASLDALRASLADATASRSPVASIDLSALSQMIDFSPEDMTVTVEAGMTVAALQSALSVAGQWLPVDPPHAEATTIAELLHYDISGPRRFAHGTIREHVLGMAMVTGDGRFIRSGGRVVKNVAGYDLAKLMVGDRGSLGAIVEVTFKLSPRPAAERIFTRAFSSFEDIDSQLEALLSGPTEPVLVDLHNLDAPPACSLVIAYAGHADDVAWQVSQLDQAWQPIEALEHETRFWRGRRVAATSRTSVLPSQLVAHIRSLAPCGFVARAGNGVVYTDGTTSAPPRPLTTLERRLKATYDPHDILPALR